MCVLHGAYTCTVYTYQHTHTCTVYSLCMHMNSHIRTYRHPPTKRLSYTRVCACSFKYCMYVCTWISSHVNKHVHASYTHTYVHPTDEYVSVHAQYIHASV